MAQLKKHVLNLLRCQPLWRVALMVSLAAIVFLATTPNPYPVPASASDKVNHLIAFIELTLLARLAWPELKAIWPAAALLAYGLGIEVVQAGLPYRDFSLADLAADAAGIAVGLALWPALARHLPPDLRHSPRSL